MRIGAMIVIAILHAAVVLGGVYYMLGAFGETLDRELDRQVDRVERNLDRDFDRIGGEIRRELDARLPPAP